MDSDVITLQIVAKHRAVACLMIAKRLRRARSNMGKISARRGHRPESNEGATASKTLRESMTS